MNFFHRGTDERLSRDEQHEIHDARVIELQGGEISGKEFVASLKMQCGFSDIDAKRQWQDIKNLDAIPIYRLKEGDKIEAPAFGKFFSATIKSFYGAGAGAVVVFDNVPAVAGATLPYAMFELRVAK